MKPYAKILLFQIEKKIYTVLGVKTTYLELSQELIPLSTVQKKIFFFKTWKLCNLFLKRK